MQITRISRAVPFVGRIDAPKRIARGRACAPTRARRLPGWLTGCAAVLAGWAGLRRLFSPANYTMPPAFSIHRPPAADARKAYMTCLRNQVCLTAVNSEANVTPGVTITTWKNVAASNQTLCVCVCMSVRSSARGWSCEDRREFGCAQSSAFWARRVLSRQTGFFFTFTRRELSNVVHTRAR